MTHRFFGLTDRPFVAAPRVDGYFAAESPETALNSTIRCLERAAGIAALIAAPGMGKTTLLQLVAARMSSAFSIAILSDGHLSTRRALLQSILHELDYPIHGRDEGDLRLSLLDGLSQPSAAPLLLLCDEAHTIPGRLLEELRLLTNVVRDGQFKVRLLLVGGPALEERLANPKLEALQQRIAARSYLHPWSRAETRDYVRAQIQRVGGDPARIFTPEALEAVFRATDGVPRLINQICDHALVLSQAAGKTQLDKHAIETAWADLQQLPPPTIVTALGTGSQRPETIEFGLLDDDLETIRLDDEMIVPTIKSPLDGENRRFHAEQLTASAPRIFDEPAGPQAEFEDESEYEFSDDAVPQMPFQPRVACTEEQTELAHESQEEFEEEEFVEDEIVFDESHLLRRIETVELQLRDLESDEIQFEFELPSVPVMPNPFSERFLEEEIVLDPFLDQSLAMFADKPLVDSSDELRIHRFEPVETLPPAPTQAAVEIVDAESNSIEFVFSQDVRSNSTGMSNSPLNTPSRATSDVAIASAAATRGKPEPVLHATDDDMIVLEETPDADTPPRVERREYRQLFAKLRRG